MTHEMILGDPGDLSAPPGSYPWSQALRLELQGLLHDSQSSAQRLHRLADAMEQHTGYAQLRDANGEAFASYADFCQAAEPFGLGLPLEAVARIVEQRLLAERAGDRVRRAAAQTTGESLPRGNSRKRNTDLKIAERARQHGISDATQHVLDRLARERPDLLTQVQAGAISVRRAALAAGIAKTATITVSLDPHKAARSLRRHFTPSELLTLIGLLNHESNIGESGTTGND